MLSVFRLDVQLDYLAVHEHTRDIDLKRARGQVEQVMVRARRFTAPPIIRTL